MRWWVLAIAAGAGSGLGCSGDDAPPGDPGGPGAPEVVCTATHYGSYERWESRMDERGLPRETSHWDVRGFASRTTFVYDDAGRLAERRGDGRPAQAGPDGEDDSVTTITYGGATATVTTTDLHTGKVTTDATYSFDGAGRPLHILENTAGTRMFQYDSAGRIRSVDENLIGFPSIIRYSEYTYGADGRPAAMHVVVDGIVRDFTLAYEESPGRLVVRPSITDDPALAVHSYEYDIAGRLTRAQERSPDDDLVITYATDGAVSVDHSLWGPYTYSAGCGVLFEVPRGPVMPSGPEPTGQHELPRIPTPYVVPSLLI
jgi:YD repeat-containing protein